MQTGATLQGRDAMVDFPVSYTEEKTFGLPICSLREKKLLKESSCPPPWSKSFLFSLLEWAPYDKDGKSSFDKFASTAA